MCFFFNIKDLYYVDKKSKVYIQWLKIISSDRVAFSWALYLLGLHFVGILFVVLLFS